MTTYDLGNFESQLRQDSLAQLQTVLLVFLVAHRQEHHQFVPCYLTMLNEMQARPMDFLEQAPQAMANVKLTQEGFGNPFLAAFFPFAEQLQGKISPETVRTLEERELLDFKASLMKAASEIKTYSSDPWVKLQLNQQLLDMDFTREQLLGPHYGAMEEMAIGSSYHMIFKLTQAEAWYTSEIRSIHSALDKLQEITQTYRKQKKEESLCVEQEEWKKRFEEFEHQQELLC